MAQGDLHIVGVANNTIWHTVFYANGSCQNFFGNVSSGESNPDDLGQISDVDCAADGANILHVTAATSTGLWHTFRTATGNSSVWQSFFGNVNAQENNPTAPGTLQQVSAAAGTGVLQVTLTSSVNGPWHIIRNQDGNWSGAFGDIHAQVSSFQNSSAIACVSDALGNLYVAGNQSGTFGALAVSVRDHTSGVWSINPVWTPDRPDPSNSVSSLSVAYNGSPNLTIAAFGGMFASYDVSQQTGKGWTMLNIASPTNPPNNITDISCAYMPNGDLVFVAVANGSLYSVRLSNGQWYPWASINNQMNNGAQVGAFSKVGISVVPTN